MLYEFCAKYILRLSLMTADMLYAVASFIIIQTTAVTRNIIHKHYKSSINQSHSLNKRPSIENHQPRKQLEGGWKKAKQYISDFFSDLYHVGILEMMHSVYMADLCVLCLHLRK